MKYINKIVLFLLLSSTLLSFYSCENETIMDEEEVYSFLEICLEDFYKNYNVELKDELNHFERYLIKEGKLKNTSGDAYRRLLISLDETGHFKSELNFDSFKEALLYKNPSNILDCAETTFKIDSLTVSETKFGQISTKIQKTLEKEDQIPVNFFFRIYYRELSPKEMEMPYVKSTIQLLLYRWYYQSKMEGESEE